MGHPDYGDLMRWGAVVLFVVIAASDALDGYLARSRNQETPLGAFLDPMADKLMITCASIILAVDAIATDGGRADYRQGYVVAAGFYCDLFFDQ